MSEQRRTYDRQYKLAAVKKVIEQGLSYAEVAREFGINAGLLRKWKQAFAVDGIVQRGQREAPPGFEPGMADLQSAALGHLATAPCQSVEWEIG